MAGNRQYEAVTVFNARVVDMRHLWTPSLEYLGKPSTKPNYFAMFIVPKTQAHWSTEPVFGGAVQAFNKLLQGSLQTFAQNPNAVVWPIVDGDMPNTATGKTSDFAKGHWMFSGSTSNAPNVELAQAGGSLVKLQNKVGVKSGDYAMCGVTAAVKQTQANAVKFYLNAVVFTAPGEEIVFANSVSGAELMRMAQQQGLQVAGFAPGAGGYGGAPGGFVPGGQQFGAPQGGFAPPNPGAPGFTPGAAPNAPMGGFAGSTAPSGPGFGGNAAYPSNPGAYPGPGNAQFAPNPGPQNQAPGGFVPQNFGR